MEPTPTELWSRVLETARPGLPTQSFLTWLSRTRASGMTEDGTLIVDTPNDLHREWVADRFGARLAEVASRLLDRPVRVEFRTAPDAEPIDIPSVEFAPSPPTPLAGVRPAPPTGGGGDRGAGDRGTARADPQATPSPPHPPSAAVTGSSPPPELKESYTFDRFVVGVNNQFAVAASRAVAETPARVYNPLFIYGGVGLGKTHLMHAVGHEVLARGPATRVAYVTAERFMNELVHSIEKKTGGEFRRYYRQIDLLLVDDVSFLGGKEATQEEFFHTFNTLYDAGKQIILTSDRPPKDLPGVEDRIVSRFEWGLVVDIKSPDYETRVAIVRKKADYDGLLLGDDVIDFIARSCTSSVRELEGAIIKLLAYSSLRREEVTVELARTALGGTLREGGDGSSPRRLTPEIIRDRVAHDWNVRPEALQSAKRTRELMVPRQVAMYLIRELLDVPLVVIGRAFGGRDHSTVIHSIRTVERAIERDSSLAERVHELLTSLRG